ncbi:MAG: ATP-grasp domain-containing protein, partial [Burkholderiales bacterium]
MLMTEHAGKSLLAAHGIAVPQGDLIRKGHQVRTLKQSYPVALKVQVASGGRGKAGGVLRADDAQQAEAAANQLLQREFGGERAKTLL